MFLGERDVLRYIYTTLERDVTAMNSIHVFSTLCTFSPTCMIIVTVILGVNFYCDVEDFNVRTLQSQ